MSNAGPEQFTTTRWTLVLAAVIRHEPSGAEAFARLCERYYAPLYGYLRRRGHTLEEAQDLTQGFIAQLIEKDVLRHVDPARGRFRAFLLTSLKHYAANIHVRATAAKRGGGAPMLSLDLAAAERRYCHEPHHGLTPECLYDRRWALTVLEAGLTALRTEFRSAGREPLFEAVHGHLTGEGDESYREIGGRLDMTEAAVKVAVHRMRRRYREVLRTIVAETVDDERELDDELRFLMSVLRQ
jgi:DNA-directed RNA polymerase specialized sigma24 family protein